MGEVLRLITLQDANTRTVLLGALLLGAGAGLAGAFAVLRRRALIGDALAHAALPGIVLAFLLLGGKSLPILLAGAAVSGLLGVACINLIRRFSRIREDAALGIVLSVFFGIGIALSGVAQRLRGGEAAGLESFLFGRAASMVQSDVVLIGAVCAVAVISVALLHKEFKLLCFDREFSVSIGRPAWVIDLVLMSVIAVVTIAGLPAVGVVLVAALLITPAAAARLWSDRLSAVLVLSACFGAVSGVAGVAVSALTPYAAGPCIALAAGVIFLFSILFAPGRGVVSRAIARVGLRRRIAAQNLLRAVYEVHEGRPAAAGAPVAASLHEILLKRAWDGPALERTIRRAVREGMAERSADESIITLTPEGVRAAQRTVRAHRLWELYLIEDAAIAPDHVDRDADALEHVMPREVLEALEARLRAAGRLPEGVPASPHPIAPTGSAGVHA